MPLWWEWGQARLPGFGLAWLPPLPLVMLGISPCMVCPLTMLLPITGEIRITSLWPPMRVVKKSIGRLIAGGGE